MIAEEDLDTKGMLGEVAILGDKIGVTVSECEVVGDILGIFKSVLATLNGAGVHFGKSVQMK